jgi:hypothetical protein
MYVTDADICEAGRILGRRKAFTDADVAAAGRILARRKAKQPAKPVVKQRFPWHARTYQNNDWRRRHKFRLAIYMPSPSGPGKGGMRVFFGQSEAEVERGLAEYVRSYLDIARTEIADGCFIRVEGPGSYTRRII